jgi:DUF2970 family protein
MNVADEPRGSGVRESVARKGSLWRTVSAVAWSFFGVRKSSDHQKDLEQINPLHLVIAGVIGAALFIAVLLGLVSWVLSSGIAR